MSALWLVRLIVAASILGLPFFGASSSHTAFPGSGPATVSAESAEVEPQEIEPEQPEPLIVEQENENAQHEGEHEHGAEVEGEHH